MEWLAPECNYPFVGTNCSSTWEDEVGTGRDVLRYALAGIYGVLMPISLAVFVHKLRCWQAKGKSLKTSARDVGKLRLLTSAAVTLGSGCASAFAATGLLFSNTLDSPQGMTSYTCMHFAIFFYYAAAGCMMLIFRALVTSSIGVKVKRVPIGPALTIFLVPYLLVVLVLFLLAILKVYTDPVVAFRVGLAFAILPVVNLAILTRRYGNPVVEAIEESVNRSRNAQSADTAKLEQLATKLKGMIRFQMINCGVAAGMYIVIALTKIVHNPVVGITIMGILWGSSILGFHLMILKDLRTGEKPQSSRRSSAQVTPSTAPMSSNVNNSASTQ